MGSNLGEKQRNIVRILCNYALQHSEVVIHIKVHPNIAGSKDYPGMKENFQFYNKLKMNFIEKENIQIHLNKDINAFELIDMSDIVIGLHSTLLDYAWYNGKGLIVDENAISRHISSIKVSFTDEDQIINAITRMRDKSSLENATALQLQLNYIYLRSNAFCIDLGTIGFAKITFHKKILSDILI